MLTQRASYFNPRPLCRGRLFTQIYGHNIIVNFNPRPLCRGRLKINPDMADAVKISIHAPYAGGDQDTIAHELPTVKNFNPRPLCRGRLCWHWQFPQWYYFNPRPLCRGRPPIFTPPLDTLGNFNPRPLCRGRLSPGLYFLGLFPFQSTPPMQGATTAAAYHREFIRISIHAPYAGGDAINDNGQLVVT